MPTNCDQVCVLLYVLQWTPAMKSHLNLPLSSCFYYRMQQLWPQRIVLLNPLKAFDPSHVHFGEACSGTVYRNASATLITNPTNQLFVPIVQWIDRTSITCHDHVALKPYMFTPALFTECSEAPSRPGVTMVSFPRIQYCQRKTQLRAATGSWSRSDRVFDKIFADKILVTCNPSILLFGFQETLLRKKCISAYVANAPWIHLFLQWFG